MSQMIDRSRLDALYQEAQSAIKARDYERASSILSQIVAIDESYQVATRLLARTIRLKRRRWYNHPALWGTLGFIAIFSLLVWLAPRLPAPFASDARASVTHTPPILAVDTPSPTPLPTSTGLPLAWRRISTGRELPRDQVTALAVAPGDPDLLYAASEVAGLHRSLDGGNSWQPVLSTPNLTGVESLIVDPLDSQHIYAVSQDALYEARDGGEHWTMLSSGSKFAILPDDPSIMYRLFRGTVSYSTDGGRNWVENSRVSRVDRLIIAPDELHTLYRYCEGCSQVYQSSDHGVTWTHFKTPGNLAKIESVWANPPFFVIGGSATDDPFVNTFASPDGGETWYEALLNPSMGSDISAAVFNAQDRLAAFICQGSAVFKTNNGGASWHQIGVIGTAFNDRGDRATSLILDPVTGTLLASGQGVYLSNDGGATWQNRSNGLAIRSMQFLDYPLLTNRFVQFPTEWMTNAWIFGILEDGQTWRNITGNPIASALLDADGRSVYQVIPLWHSYAISSGGSALARMPAYESACAVQSESGSILPNPITPGVLFAYCGQRLFRLAEYGSRMEPADLQALSDPYARLVRSVFDLAGRSGYTLFSNGEIAHTLDSGLSWTICTEGGSDLLDMALDLNDPATLYLASPDAGLLQTQNGCQSWEPLPGPGSQSIHSVALSLDGKSLYIAADQGAYLSTDLGQTWNLINDGLLGLTRVYSIIVDSQGVVYAATPYGIFQLESK